MNSAHLHLIVVHLPIILVPLGGIMLAIGRWRKTPPISNIGWAFFMIAATFAVAAFLSGEAAEEVVEEMPGILESTIEAHEDSAGLSLTLTVLLGLGSGLAFLARRYISTESPRVVFAALAVCIAATVSLGYTAQQGGRIQHPEAFSATIAAEHFEEEGEDDDD